MYLFFLFFATHKITKLRFSSNRFDSFCFWIFPILDRHIVISVRKAHCYNDDLFPIRPTQFPNLIRRTKRWQEKTCPLEDTTVSKWKEKLQESCCFQALVATIILTTLELFHHDVRLDFRRLNPFQIKLLRLLQACVQFEIPPRSFNTSFLP